MKPRRFFYHFNKKHNKMTIHYRGVCHIVGDVDCRVSCETKWNKRQPRLVMRGFAEDLIIEGNKGVLI